MFDVVLQNRTPFLAENHVQMDQDGQEVLVSVLSATFARNAADLLDLAAEQVPVCLCDEPFGEPGRSSIRIEADVVAEKPRVDVVLNGAAYAPNETLMLNEVYLAIVHRPTSGMATGLASKVLARAQRGSSELALAEGSRIFVARGAASVGSWRSRVRGGDFARRAWAGGWRRRRRI